MNLINVVEEKGPKFDQGEFLRFISEMPWYPSFYLDADLKWSRNGDKRLDVELNDKAHNNNVSGTIIFDEKELIEDFTTKRFYSNAKEVTLEEWHEYWENYETIHDILIPTKFKVFWDFDDQDYCYIRGTITDMEFNNPKLY